jgi:phosphinothricin acetyltransferase
MRRILCGRSYAPQILSIFNDAIATSTALWDYHPRTSAMMDGWFGAKEAAQFPVIGLVDDADRLVAFGSYGTFRAWPAYKYSVEHSVYVERANRGKGLGTAVLLALIEQATREGYHTLIGGIEARNTASIALHEKCGFELCGTIRQAGFKFGEWLDLSFYQLLLQSPAHPVDG